jgi:hypothetical protein
LTRSDYSTEDFAGFLADLKESFWGDLRGQARQTLKRLLDEERPSAAKAAMQFAGTLSFRHD